MEKKSQKPCLRNYNLLIAQDLWPACYQILLIILLKEFIKLNVNTDMIMKNETCWINYKNYEYCLENVSVKDHWIEYKCLCCSKTYPRMFNENF